MAKNCPHCHSSTSDNALFCDTCGCDFLMQGVVRPASAWMWRCIAALIAIAVAVAVYVFLKK
jgi:hypothetical protein